MSPAVPQLLSTAYFSRRRQASGQTQLPDWVWGAGLGVLAVFFIGLFLFVSGALDGGSDSGCDSALAPLGTSTVDAETFQEVDASMTRVVSALQAGDRAGAQANFYGPTHNFTHNVDPPLREVDEGAAKELCRAVLDIESSMEQGTNAEALNDAQRVQTEIRNAADILGYSLTG